MKNSSLDMADNLLELLALLAASDDVASDLIGMELAIHIPIKMRDLSTFLLCFPDRLGIIFPYNQLLVT